MKIGIFVPIKCPFLSTRGPPPPCKLSKKAFRAQTESVFKVPRQSVIHIQDLNEIYFVSNLGYEDLRETAT